MEFDSSLPLPADVDLRDFPFMPLDVVRLRDSDLAATATDAEFRAAVTLWCVSWHQVPAASLPDDDSVLSVLAGFGRSASAIAEWKTCREGALRGFVKANDGRLYHPVIAAKAVEAWERKRSSSAARGAHKERMKRWREVKANGRNSNENTTNLKVTDRDMSQILSRDDHVTSTCDDHVTSLIGTGTGTGIGKENKILHHPSDDAVHQVASIASNDAALSASSDAEPEAKRSYPGAFEVFWHHYPRKVGKLAAFNAWKRAKAITTYTAIQDAVMTFAASVRGKDPQYIPHPSTWLNGGRWDDDAAQAAQAATKGRDSFGVGG